MTTTTRRSFPRQRQIRAALRTEYAALAVNEMHVAKLRFEMSSLPHDHKWIGQAFTKGERECAWCLMGTDHFNMTWEQIEAEVRDSEKQTEEIMEVMASNLMADYYDVKR